MSTLTTSAAPARAALHQREPVALPVAPLDGRLRRVVAGEPRGVDDDPADDAGGAEPDEVSIDSLVAAASWVDDYAKSMAERVYGDAALPPVERSSAVLARYIRKAELRQVNKRELRRSPHKSRLPGLRDNAVLEAVLAHLVDAGWLREAPSRDGPSTGRQREDYLVNPAVFGGEA